MGYEYYEYEFITIEYEDKYYINKISSNGRYISTIDWNEDDETFIDYANRFVNTLSKPNKIIYKDNHFLIKNTEKIDYYKSIVENNNINWKSVSCIYISYNYVRR